MGRLVVVIAFDSTIQSNNISSPINIVEDSSLTFLTAKMTTRPW